MIAAASAPDMDYVLVEVLGNHDRVRSRSHVALSPAKRSLIIGRSALADVVLDDEYVAARHAEIHISPEGVATVTDLETVNGITIAGTRHHRARALPLANGELQVGRTRLRIRTANESLPPEKADDEVRGLIYRHSSWVAGIGVALCALYLGHATWVGAPRDVASVVLPALLYALMLAGGWIAVWALLSRVTLGEWRWIRHAAVIFSIAAAFYLLNAALDLGGFAFALPLWEKQEVILAGVAIAFALYGHLTNASRLRNRRALVIAGVIPALAIGTLLWVESRNELLNVNHIAVRDVIYPPVLRVRGAGSLEQYFGRASSLAQAADAKRKAMPRGMQNAEDADTE